MRPMHFEIQGSRPEELVNYYCGLFGWQVQKIEGMDYWMLHTGEGEGISGAVMPRTGEDPALGAPVMGATIVIDCPDIDTLTSRAKELGGREYIAKFAVPGMGWVSYTTDPCGNVFGIWQSDKGAK